MKRLSRLSAFAALAALTLAPASASAGGFEYAAAGTRALGRGGAFAARADDPMALGYNPAMLADLPDTQLMVNTHLGFYDACVQRPGTFGEHTTGDTIFNRPGGMPDAWQNEAMPRVCNSSHPGPSPNIVASFRLTDEVGLAFGLLAPSAVGNSRWGNSDGTMRVGSGLVPAPTRYGLVESDLLLFHPSVGVGWRIIPELRIGFTFQWGMGFINFTNMTNSSTGPEDPYSDVRTRLSVADFFVPAGILSIHYQPNDNFDIMLSGRISDAVGGITDASGHLDLTTRAFGTDGAGNSVAETTRVNNVTLRAGQPWQFTAGIRYADRIRPRSHGRTVDSAMRGVVNDAMNNENFDLELNVVYEMNRQVQDFYVRLPAGSSATVDGTSVPLAMHQPIPHGWHDVVGIRFGGDWNILPGFLAARAGVHTEIPTGQSRYQIQDFVSGFRVGLHLGATIRIDRLDLSIAYAHIFQSDVTVTDGNFRAITASGMDNSAGCGSTSDYSVGSPVSQTGCYPLGYGAITNNGTYTAGWNVVSLQARYHFE